MPNFKKAGGKIFGVQFTAKEQEAISREIGRQAAMAEAKISMETDAAILWALRIRYGFGPKKLKAIWKDFVEAKRELWKHYELGEEDADWICLYKLKEAGVDLAEWYKEEGVTGAETLGE